MGACVLGVTAQVGFRVGYDIPKNVALLRSVSVNLAELRRAQTRFRALAGKDICSLCDKNIMQIPSISCCWQVFKLCFMTK